MRIHSLGIEQALASLNTSAAGIHASEAAHRLAEYGPNHLEEVAHEHLLLRFAQGFTHFFAIILWIGAALAFVAEHFDPGQGMARLGVAIIGVIIINGIFSFWQEYKAEQAVTALRQLLPQSMSIHQLWVGGAFLACADLGARAHLLGDHRELFVNAALCHNLKEIEEQGRHTLHGDPMEIALAEIGREMAGAGLRVLAFAHRTVSEEGVPEEEQGMVLAGLIGLEDPPRAEVLEAIARCVAAGIRIIMVTDDYPRTALAIACQIGMVRSERPVVVSGEQLRLMSPTQLQLVLDAPEILFARVAAEQKMRIVEALKNKGEIVAVTGDGVNDAILYTPAGNWLFGTAPIGATIWLLAATCAATMCLLEELCKCWLRQAVQG